MKKEAVKKTKSDKFTTTHIIEKSLRHHVIEWVATVFSIVAAILNAKLLIDGYTASFFIWTAGNIFWISFALKHKHYGLLLTSIIYTLINILAIAKIYGLF